MNLPKKDDKGISYLSYSQYAKWKHKRKEYFKQYFFGEKFEGNPYTDFGSLIGESLEKGDFSEFGDREVELLSKVTRLDEFEREIRWDLGDFFIKGYIDTNSNVSGLVTTIIDYKTGAAHKKEEYESDDYTQVTVYAGAIGQETGTLPTEGWVELVERVGGNPYKGGVLSLGTKVIKIPQDVSKEAVEAVKEDLVKVAKEISDSYEIFNRLNSVKV